MTEQQQAAQIAEDLIATAWAMPDGNWHISHNLDGGAAAEDFIRMFARKHAAEIVARHAERTGA